MEKSGCWLVQTGIGQKYASLISKAGDKSQPQVLKRKTTFMIYSLKRDSVWLQLLGESICLKFDLISIKNVAFSRISRNCGIAGLGLDEADKKLRCSVN
ncbi:MAG: hypothetical protein ISR61_00185 [Desulfobacteraceae bacterium]|nr:hypothetical protein [Deltaproteobacteria bacterium]MBL6977332.1 hypothetical protein [Desulfobacteraceae bacterium]